MNKTVNKTARKTVRKTPPAPPARVLPAGPRKRVAAVMPPKARQTLASVAPPPPRQSLASVASVTPVAPVAPSKPRTVVHIPSREPTQQFPFSAPSAKRGRKRREDTVPYAVGLSGDHGTPEAQVIPLVRVAPDDIAIPLVSEEPTDEMLQSAPRPFIADDPNEDLLSPYRPSLFRSITRTVKNFLD